MDQFNNREGYYEYVSCGVDKQIAEIYQRKHCPSILGSEVFKSQCLEKLNWNKINESLPDIKRCKDVLPISDVINKVAICFNTSSKNIIDSRRGVENLPRILCMTICRYFYGYKIGEIATCMSKITPKAVSTIVGRTIKRIEADAKFRELYDSVLAVVR